MAISKIKVGGTEHELQTTIANIDGLQAALDELDCYGAGTSIPTGSDLDTYTTVGKYFMGSESGAQSLLNCPTTTNFCMYVIVRTSGSSKTQIVVCLNGKMYVRSCNSSGEWRAWQAYTTESDLITLRTTIEEVLATKAASSHTHDDRYYTESEVDSKLSGKANSSHGNHVPTAETANNAKFLRNDNTWQTVTPANIGAAPTSHASSATTYGQATSSNYGHVKLSDSVSSTSAASSGVGASPKAVKSAYDLANAALPKSGGTLTASSGNSPLTLKSASTKSNLQFSNSSGTHLGYVGYDADGNPVIGNAVNAIEKVIIHGGNIYDYAPPKDHTHNYAGSSSAGGAATSANKINTDAGSTTQPVYFSNGIPVKTTYTLGASVPSDAKFTDTVYTLPAATSSALGGVKVGSNITNSSGTISLTKANVTSALGYTPPTTDTNTTYSAGTGISLSGTTFSNSGVRSVATGSTNGTISVNTNGTAANVAVKGLGSAAYTASTAYAAASHNQAASTITSGTLAAARLPNATTSAKGAVKVGRNLTVSSGTLSLSESNVINALGTDALSKLGIEVVNVCGSEGVTVTTTTAGAKMKMPITTVIGATKNAANYFTMQNGYLKTKKAGLYLITGNVYMTCAASASTGNWPSRAGVYIHTTNASVTANPDYTTWTEAAASIVFIPPNCEGDVNINTDIRLVYLNGGASISLVGRIAGGTSSGKLYCGGSSSLLVAYLGPTNGTIYNA